jgi:hypothetical protein
MNPVYIQRQHQIESKKSVKKMHDMSTLIQGNLSRLYKHTSKFNRNEYY